MDSTEIFKVTGCHVEIAGKTILAPTTFTLNKGDLLTISGRSGTGKSTLLQVLLGFIKPTNGTVKYRGNDLSKTQIQDIRKSVATVFQEPILLNGTVQDTLLEPFTYKYNRSKTPENKSISTLFNDFDLNHISLDTTVSTLSGGEKQRLALVRALLLNRKTLILDEISSALDKAHKELVFNYLSSSGLTILAVSHDLQWIEKSPKRLILNPELN